MPNKSYDWIREPIRQEGIQLGSYRDANIMHVGDDELDKNKVGEYNRINTIKQFKKNNCGK